jgi:hypothetical protein
MSGIALARINSFAFGPTGHDLAGRIGFELHALAERVAIFGEETINLKQPMKIICYYMK